MRHINVIYFWLLLCVLSFAIIPTNAQDFFVTDNSPYASVNGRCSLVEAIDNANADAMIHADCPAGAGADIIQLNRVINFNGTTLFSSSSVFFDAGDSALPDITSDITIIGGGLRRVGATDFRFLVVLNTGNLTLEDMSISNGSVVGECNFTGVPATGCGGAIVSSNGAIILSNVMFSNNQANEGIASDLAQGGAIMMFGGSLTISESEFANNSAEIGGALDLQNTTVSIADTSFTNNTTTLSGGAIYKSNPSSMTIAGSTFTGNQVTTTGFPFNGGGAIDNAGSNSQLTVINTTFTSNIAPNGGAINNFNASDANIINSTFTGNSTNSVFGNGGAIMNRGSGATVNVFSSTITGNTASNGGGINNGGSSDTGIANIFNSTISNNTATGNGGGISTRGNLTIEYSTLDNNNGSSGGGIFVGSLTNQDVIITASTISNNGASSVNGGGGIHFSVDPSGSIPNQLIITDSTLDNNQGGRGGGVFGEDVQVTITRSTISNNISTANGGGLHIRSGTTTGATLNLNNSTVSGNNTNSSGGGVFLNQEVDADITNSTIAFNSAGSGSGADGIQSNVTPARVTVQNSILAYNDTINCFQGTGLGLTDGGSNISSDATCGFADTGSVGIGDGIDPLLNTLVGNGGKTETHALQTGSPAVDNANAGSCPTTDQRGAGRTNVCDIGSYEGTTTVADLSVAVDETILYEVSGTVATVTITLDNTGADAQDVSVIVPLRVIGDGTGAGFDYIQSNQNGLAASPPGQVNPITINALAGQVVTETFTVTILDDTVVENNELINIIAGLVGNATLMSNDSIALTLISDDVLLVIAGDGVGDDNDNPVLDSPEVADNSSLPNIGVFDPSISKLGFLLPNELGVLGEKLRWDVTVVNAGNEAGINVVITDTLRPELRIDNVTTSKGTVNISGQTVTVTISVLGVGEQVDIDIFTTSLGGAIVDNTACVDADNKSNRVCATGLPITSLPNTGQSPQWRNMNMLMMGLSLILGLFVVSGMIFLQARIRD